MKNKRTFLKSEYKNWEYWRQFSYAEYLRINAQDAVKCKCGTYYWKGFKKKCACEQSKLN